MTSQFGTLFVRHVVRYALRHRLLFFLNVLSVALGVAVFLAIQIANRSAGRSFAATIDVVAGKANLEVRGASGTLDDALFPKVSRMPGVVAATPVLEETLTLPDFPGDYLQLLGIDPFTNPPFRTFDLAVDDSRGFELERWLAWPDGIAIAEKFARQHSLAPGDKLRVMVDGRTRDMRVSFVMKLRETAGAANSRFAAMDIGWAQELFGKAGHITSIQVIADGAQIDAVAQRLREALGPVATVQRPGQRSEQVEKMIAGFQLNLTAMSLVSLLVGMFLIYNTVSASVVRRRAEIGILRAIGASCAEVRSLFLGEALLSGVVGIAVGIAGGIMLANALLGTVARTVSSFYVLTSLETAFLSPLAVALAAGLGLASVIVAAWPPANEGARTDPVAALNPGTLRERGHAASPRLFALGIGAIALAAALSWLSLRSGPAGLSFAAAFFILAGFAMLAPLVTAKFSALVARVFAGSVVPRLAAENLAAFVHRTSFTVAALTAAIAMMAGVTVMIFSFRRTVDVWIGNSIIADLLIAPSSNEIIGPRAFIDVEALRFLEQHPQISAVDTYRRVDIQLRGEPVVMAAVRGSGDRRNLAFVGGDNRVKIKKFFSPGYIIVTESFARRFHVRDGDTLALPTPRGPAQFVVAGVYYDYTNDRGLILIDRQNFDTWWADPRVQSLALYFKPGSDQDAVMRDFLQRFSPHGEYLVYTNAQLRKRIFEIFDQTFAVTYVLRAIAVVVAIVGIFLTLTTLVAERERDIGVLRSIGASRAQVQCMFLCESALIGILASGLGLAAGGCLAMVLTWVINKAFFGWTIQLSFPWVSLALVPLWIVLAALAAGWLPSIRAARIPIGSAVRSE